MSIASVTSQAAGGAAAATPVTANDAASSDRFLKLLVAQMQNQDPLNPMDNAQVTTQMAQIQTVSGIDKLNGTVAALSGQFAQLQALQGANLVGRDVVVQGDRLSIDSGVAQGGFELTSPADNVKVEILDASGRVLDTLNLGAAGAGKHGFDWPAEGVDPAAGLRFRVSATSGALALPVTTLMRDRVDAVSTGGDTLNLELRLSGSVPYAAIKAFN